MKSPVFRFTAAVSVLATMTLLAGCKGHDADRKEVMPPQAVTVATVTQRAMSGGLTASGRFVPREEMAVSADLSGFRIAKVFVEEGAVVRAGQVLAQLDDSLLVSQIGQLRAGLAQQQVAYEQAREQAGRVDGLEGQGVLSNEAIATRKFAQRNAAAAEAATKAQLNDLLVRQNHLAIRAPANGLVLERTARPGETSSTGTALFTMARDSLLELYAELPELDAAGIKIGDPVEVTLASGRKLDGHVRLIGERVDTNTGVVIARIALPVDRDLRQGGFARATFSRPAQVLALPEAAVRYDADGANVMVIDRDDHVHRLKVRTGRHADGLVELRDGPPAGSRVAVRGAAFTLDGDKVRIAGAAK
ncbi:HlyD family secretion protein [Novosphingobium sp. PhB165]|uniref:efflux RND transporter periplasmic adaptor subunit n=1 Tax=Novosphingobium sp. PhB165 TaxID=2485105 RepID=UPI0010D90BEE|nr:efflux RND transporter periplasmic adaptor subunit [Novosphingobium sp. PhB165]TCM20903.1 HlyD family secretion protein [Novosphingobium sp. PhB165]